jgi:DNA-binding NarL/FixJ family response regulator
MHGDSIILVADPSPVICEGLRNILLRDGYFSNIRTATGLSEVDQFRDRAHIEAVIMNPVLIQNQTEVFHHLRASMEQTKWIGLIYSYHDPRLLQEFDTTIQINEQPEDILATVQKTINANRESDTASRQVLSDRETDVLKLLVTGFSNKEIADKLFISIHTVISHRKNISIKTGIKSVSGLTIYAVVKNLVSIDNFS